MFTEAGAGGQAFLPVRSHVAVGLRHGHEVAPTLYPAAVERRAPAIPLTVGRVLQISVAVSEVYDICPARP